MDDHIKNELLVEVDVPPSVNNLYISVRRKGACHRVLTSEGRNYKQVAGWAIIDAARECDWEYNGERLSMCLDISFKDRRRRDITNCIKIIEDAASEVLGFDDTMVDAFLVRRVAPNKKRPGARLYISKLDTDMSDYTWPPLVRNTD
jgi:Holliday junction resolvase RusA-like endonuclease